MVPVARILAVILVVVPVVRLAQASGTSEAVEVADFERGTEGLIAQESSAGRIDVVREVDGLGTALEGASSARFRCGPQDEGVAGAGEAWRTELRVPEDVTAAEAGTTQVWHISVRLGEDLEAPPTPQDWLVLAQFHPAIERSSPQLALELGADDDLLLRVRGGDAQDPVVETRTLLREVERSVTHEIELHVRWSAGADGFVSAAVDGRTVLPALRSPNTINGAEPYLKFGCYRSAADVGEGTLWVDAVRWNRPSEQQGRLFAWPAAAAWVTAGVLAAISSARFRQWFNGRGHAPDE